MIKIFHSVAILSVLFAANIYSQQWTDKEIDTQFRNAISLFESGDLNQAYDRFEKISRLPAINSRTTASEFFKAKILVEQNRSLDAIDLIHTFFEQYPGSKYADEVRALLIQAYTQDGQYNNALDECLYLLKNSEDKLCREEAKSNAEIICYNYLTTSEIQSIETQYFDDNIKSFLLLQLGRLYFKENDIFSAKSTLSALMNKYPTSAEYDKARELYKTGGTTETGNNTNLIIGVLLPLSTKSMRPLTSLPGEEILGGIKFAVWEFNKTREQKCGLIIRDSENDADKIEEIQNEFASIPEIQAVLGPVFSDEVRYAIDDFEDTSIPVISPTATDDDLTAMSYTFFQANPSFSIRGKIMAQYIYYVENKKNIAILNSIDGYSPALAANFANEFERLGGRILVRQSYKSKEFDLKEPINAIAAFSEQLDGIYIPLSSSLDATNILSQMVQCSLAVPIYGNQDWFSAKGFESSSELSNKITFTSDYFIDYKNDEYQKMSKEYAEVTGKDVNRNFLYGYDLAKYILTVMRNINVSRSNIINKMLTGMMVSGFHNNIAFGEDRVNQFLNIIRYRDGIFELVDKFRYSK